MRERPIILPLAFWLTAIFALVGGLAYCSKAQAGPVAKAEGEATVILYDEPCALDEVKNLPFRATWQEGGAIIEGCFGLNPVMPMVMLYFADKTVVIVPRQVFGPVTES